MSFALSLNVDRAALSRGLLAGTAWGLAMAAGLYATTLAQCDVICLDNIAFTTLTCVLTGIATIGPIAAFSRR